MLKLQVETKGLKEAHAAVAAIMADLAEPQDGFYIIIALELEKPRILTDSDGFTLKYTSLQSAENVLLALNNSGSQLPYFIRQITF